MKPRINDLITVFLIQLVLTLPFYSSNVYGLTISNVRVTKAAANSATIEWNTDNTSSGKVRYGQTTGLGFTQRHDNFLLNHTITVINGISSNTLYFFSVESTDINGNTTVDNNSNNFYTFRTLDITPPQQVAGLKVLSTTFDSVSLSWNAVNASDLSHYVIYRDRIPAANSTSNSFIDTGLSSNTEFIYKVSAVDTSDNEGPLSDTVIASTLRFDTTPPIISSVEALPLTDATARITWLTDENSTTTAFYGINKTDNTRSIDGFAINHSIVVDKLIKNNVYIFTVRSCDSSDNCANSSGNFTSGKDATIPFLNLSIPKCVNRRTADIIGTTEPFSKVTLFVNDFNVPKRSLGSSEVGSSGKFVFSQVQLQDSNTIKIAIEDRSGNKNQKTFDVKVDTQDPAVQLSEVPSLVSKLNLSFSGSADEPVTIRVFADADANKSSVPSKINGLNATKIRQNSVELGWNESKDKDFSHYAVYRSDIGAIAVTKPSNFNLYIDALVDSGKSYTYYVSAVNIFGAEGEKSERITVTTSKGGEVLNLKPAAVDIFEDFRKPLLVVNTTGKFNFGVKLDKGDGDYTIKAIFEDCAENSVTIQKDVTLDTKKPEVKITSPSSGAFIFENVANEIDVIGKTKPNARVHLFVDRTPFSFYNQSFELSGLPNEVQDLDEAKLDAKCRSSVSVSFCRTGADFSVDADEQGNFKFENVDLTTIFGGASRIREVPVTDFRDTQLNQEAQESKKTTLVVIATDKVGQRGVATQTVRIGTCWSGNQSWDIIPLTQYQSPTFLSTERFAEGTETAYFYFNYSYIGRGQSAKITDISLSKACGTREVLDPRFNISCQIMPSGNSPVKLNKPDNTLSYSAVPLSRFLGMDRFLEDDWKSFFKSINNELTLPFKVRITYEHDVTNENGQSVRVKETQTTCEQVSYVVDNSIIDPRKVLPDWLLFDFVDVLQKSITTITQVQQQIDTLINYVGVGCLGSILASTIVKIWRNWAEFSDEKLFKVKGALNINFKLESDQKNQDCKDIANAVEKGYGSLKLKYFSDADLKNCFPLSASVWDTESKIYQLQRWSCDRIFGHSAPSGWTETASDDELHRTMTSSKTCGSDTSVQGQRFRTEECKDIEGRYRTTIFNFEKQPIGKKCFQIKSNPKSPQEYYVYTLDDQQDSALISNKIYRLTRYETRPTDEVLYAIKINENNYITKQQKTCAQLCGLSDDSQKKSKITVDGKIYELSKDEPKSKDSPVKFLERPQSKDTRIAGCVTVNQCREWHAKSDPKAGGIIFPGRSEALKNYKVESKGYSSDCFYENGDNPEIVSDTNPNLREECCCVNGKAEPFKDVYYQPDDVDPKLNPQFQKPVHSSKSKPLEPPQKTDKDSIGYSDIEWSYRYSKIGYLGKKYNPNRYIEGRDLPACFGQDNLAYKIANKEKEILIVDPAKQDTATLIPCVYLTGVNQRLQRIKVIMSATSNCLIQVRTTGRADGGVCKELFTQHLCDAIWQGIRFFIDGCTPDFIGPPDADRETKFLEDLQGTLKGISQGVSEAQKEISDEYSNAKLNDLLGTGEESIARKACLFAFGYDWEFNVKNLIDAAYSAPFATLVQAVTRSREFLTVDPQSLKPKYEYRASWIINPGCDLERYDIKLACVSRKELDKYPNQIDCSSVGAGSIGYTGRTYGLGEASTGFSQCDCLELPQEELESGSFFSESRISQNSLVDKNNHKVIESNRRYDHLKFILRTDRKIASGAKSNCFPTGYEEGVFYFPITDKTARDIADCTIDLTLGLINCGSGTVFFSRKGTAQLIEVTINGENANKVKELSIGDRLEVGARVTKTGQDKCLRVSISPDPIQPVFTGITLNGTNDIAPIRITDELRVAGRRGDVVAKGISYSLRAQNNRDIVTISVKAFDGDNKDKIYGKGDRVVIDGEDITLGTDGEYGTSTKIRVADKTVTVQKDDAIIEIKDITYTQTQAGSYELQEIITINQPQQTAQTTQQKTILVELFHLKEGRDSYNNPDDCSLNEKIGEGNKYTITISQTKGTDASKLGPLIQNPAINPKSPITIGQKIVISSRITHSEGISEANVSITGPGRLKLFDKDQFMSRDGNNFEFIFETNGRAKGKYSGSINALSRTNTKSDKSFEFDLIEPPNK